MFSAMEALYETDARRLDKFIFDHLQPNQAFLNRVSDAIRIICEFLRETCFRDAPPPRPRVLKVVKGGSSGKGTALKGVSDADLVVFLSTFKTYKDQELNRREIIQEIQKRLEEFRNKQQKNIDVIFEETKWSNPRVLSFELCSYDRKDSIKFDVLPAFDALGQRTDTTKPPPPQVYLDLIKSSSRGGEYSPCFTELQRDFIIDRPTKLKSLIRLLKHWYKEYVCVRYGSQVPPKYALELLAVYAWEKGSREPDFDMAEGFQTVLWLLQQYKQLCIFWTVNYDLRNPTLKQYLMGQLRKPRPLILDPADPTGLLGEGSRWDLLAQEAERCSRQICCTNYSVLHWDVPLQVSWEEETFPVSYPMTPARPASQRLALCLNVKLLTGEMHSLNITASRTIWDLKVQIAQKSGVPPYQQRLAWQNNTHLDLRDGALLSEFGLQSGDTIVVVVKNEESITIFLKNDKGRTSTYKVMPSDKVDHFKTQVQQQENIHAEQFWLTYEGRSLENGRKLSDYNIAPHGTIYLNLRLRGGWIGQDGLLSFSQCFSDF